MSKKRAVWKNEEIATLLRHIVSQRDLYLVSTGIGITNFIVA